MADGIQVEVDLSKLTKGFDKLGKAGELALKQAARAIGGEAVGYAKANCPVDTGLLRNSITFAISGSRIHTGFNLLTTLYIPLYN